MVRALQAKLDLQGQAGLEGRRAKLAPLGLLDLLVWRGKLDPQDCKGCLVWTVAMAKRVTRGTGGSLDCKGCQDQLGLRGTRVRLENAGQMVSQEILVHEAPRARMERLGSPAARALQDLVAKEGTTANGVRRAAWARQVHPDPQGRAWGWTWLPCRPC